jgi:hypothetical protein
VPEGDSHQRTERPANHETESPAERLTPPGHYWFSATRNRSRR